MNQHPQNKHVLIVEDSPDIRQLLTILLRAKGYTTDSTSNGEEALRLLNSTLKLPDLILVDLRMPVLDGVGFLKSKNGSQRLKHIPTVIMSGDENIELTQIKTNATAVLIKPFNLASVIESVERNTILHRVKQIFNCSH